MSERRFLIMMNLKKKLVPAVVGAGAALASCVPVFAEGADTTSALSSVESAMTTSFTSVGSSMTGMVAKILPIALPVMGALLLIGFGIKAFKKVANKA